MSDKVRVRHKRKLQQHRKNYNTLRYIQNRLIRRGLKNSDVMAISSTLLITVFENTDHIIGRKFENDLYELVKKYTEKGAISTNAYEK